MTTSIDLHKFNCFRHSKSLIDGIAILSRIPRSEGPRFEALAILPLESGWKLGPEDYYSEFPEYVPSVEIDFGMHKSKNCT